MTLVGAAEGPGLHKHKQSMEGHEGGMLVGVSRGHREWNNTLKIEKRSFLPYQAGWASAVRCFLFVYVLGALRRMVVGHVTWVLIICGPEFIYSTVVTAGASS